MKPVHQACRHCLTALVLLAGLMLVGCETDTTPTSSYRPQTAARLPADVASKIGSRKLAALETTTAGPFDLGLAVLNATSLGAGEPITTLRWLENSSNETWSVDLDTEPVSLAINGSRFGGESRRLGAVELVGPGEVYMIETSSRLSATGELDLSAATSAIIRPVDRRGGLRSLSATTQPVKMSLD